MLHARVKKDRDTGGRKDMLKVMSTNDVHFQQQGNKVTEVLFVTSYPPRECGIATYSRDLIKVLNRKFSSSLRMSVCAIGSDNEQHSYPAVVKYSLNTDHQETFTSAAIDINENDAIGLVVIQHEFGFFAKNEQAFQDFLHTLEKPVVMVFHTVLPRPDDTLKLKVQELAGVSVGIIVMTKSSESILMRDYGVAAEKITVIPHGTHLVPHSDKDQLKARYGMAGKKVLATFGLLSSGKSIETTLDALTEIVKIHPDVLFLVIGKTHPSVVKHEGERYRDMLEAKVRDLQLEQNVRFLNFFVPLADLLEYLQLTDIYLFTSKDPNQAVSGTFSYAISCGCAVVSTPIPHAREVLQDGAGIIVDFEHPQQLGDTVIKLLSDEKIRTDISMNGLHRIASTSWENAAIAHSMLFGRVVDKKRVLTYNVPAINLDHVKKMTTDIGIIQFSKLNRPDIESGYTLDDNARAMIAMCQHYELTADSADLQYIGIYLRFIQHCLGPDGDFLNYVDANGQFTEQNDACNLADANGRAIWALGYLCSLKAIVPRGLFAMADGLMKSAMRNVHEIHSTRAIAFVIKGLYYYNVSSERTQNKFLIRILADRLVQMYRHEEDNEWQWFESYLTYANAVLPEAMLCAWLATGESIYRSIAKSSFDFLLSKTFTDDRIEVISNRTWLHKGAEKAPASPGGEQPIEIAYTILALDKFYEAFGDAEYKRKLEISFNWFLGANHLHQIIYNPCTGGCYDGLEAQCVNLNQGAESTLSYIMARLIMEQSQGRAQILQLQPYSFTKLKS